MHISSLKINKESNHEVVKYSGDSFDYKVSQLISLKRHKESTRKVVTYSCDSCSCYYKDTHGKSS